VAETRAVLTNAVGRRSQSLRSVWLFLLLGLAAVVVPFVEHWVLYSVVLGLFLCLAVPLWLCMFRGELDYFEPIHIFGLVYFVFFGLGSIWTVNDPIDVANDYYIAPYVTRAAFFCLLGYLAFLAGYYGPWKGRLATRPAGEIVRGPLFLAFVGGIGVAGFLAIGIIERLTSLRFSIAPVIGTLSQLSPIFLFAWALGWLLVFSGRATRAQKLVIGAILIPGALITTLATISDKSLLMTIVGIPVVARWYTRRRVPWTFLAVLLLLLVFVVFPFYNAYRWSDPRMGERDRLEVTYRTIHAWDSEMYMRHSLRTFVRRMALINSVAVVIRDVDRWVPYAMGSTVFTPTLVSFIPRVLWPDKPVITLGLDFGRTFRVTNSLTKDTHIAPTIPGELYWNFGLPGIVLGMALLGYIVRALYRRFGEGLGHDPVRCAIHILILVELAHLGGSLAATFVSVLRTLIVIAVLRAIGRHFGLLQVVPAEGPRLDDPRGSR